MKKNHLFESQMRKDDLVVKVKDPQSPEAQLFFSFQLHFRLQLQ